MDRRIQKTKAAVFAAFETLLLQKSYDKITIQELIDKANIGRSTFYAHFETKDDLLRGMCGDLFDHIFSTQLKAEETHDFSGAHGKTKSRLTHILYHLKDEEQRLNRIFSCESSELFWQYFRGPFAELVDAYICPVPRRKNPDLPQDFLVNHISSSFIETVKWWFKNGLKESPEVLEHYFEAAVFPAI